MGDVGAVPRRPRLVVASGLPGFYADPIENRRAFARRIGDEPARHQTARQALESGPKYFAQIIDLLGSKDGREGALALDELREQGILARLDNGEWTLKTQSTN